MKIYEFWLKTLMQKFTALILHNIREIFEVTKNIIRIVIEEK